MSLHRVMMQEERINLCKYCIQLLETVDKTDPRQPPALEHYQRQLAKLEGRPFEPPEIVIGLKTAVLFAKPQGIGE